VEAVVMPLLEAAVIQAAAEAEVTTKSKMFAT
jgi:hypothetical protein